MRVITPLDMRRSLGRILDEASAGERFLIERDHQPLACIVSVEDAARLDATPDEVRNRRLAAITAVEEWRDRVAGQLIERWRHGRGHDPCGARPTGCEGPRTRHVQQAGPIDDMSVRRVVCDASYLLAWLFDEPEGREVRAELERWASQDIEVAVPSLFWLEVGNVLAGRRRLSDDQVLDALMRLEALGITTIEPDRPVRLLAMQLARTTGLTTYDGLYLALARSLDAELRTFDAAMLAVLATERHGAREASLAYGSPRPDRHSVEELGRQLALLREEVVAATR